MKVKIEVIEALLKGIEVVHGTEEALRWRRFANLAKILTPRSETEMSTKQELTDEITALREKNTQLEAANAALLADLNGDGAKPYQPDETALAVADASGVGVENVALDRLALAMGVNPDHMEDCERVEDSLAKAIEHDRKLRETLGGDLAAARLVINRMAAIFNVQKWDADGSEIVEKAQRWVGFGHDLKRRLKALETAFIGSVGANALRFARIEEVTAMYARFMGTGDLAKWLATIPSDVSTVAMMDAADPAPVGLPESEPEDRDAISASELRKFIGVTDEATKAGEWAALRDLPSEGFQPKLHPGKVANLLVRAYRSNVAMETLLKVLNLVILPHLRKIGA